MENKNETLIVEVIFKVKDKESTIKMNYNATEARISGNYLLIETVKKEDASDVITQIFNLEEVKSFRRYFG